MFMQLMNALKHIHSNNLVHRDIKPDNIFVNTKTKKLLIGDFGLAKNIVVKKEPLKHLSKTAAAKGLSKNISL